MKNYDVILIHPPRVISQDHSKNTRFIRGNYIFIPMGVFSIADFLEREGFGVKIINYPLEQYVDRDWSLYKFLKNIDVEICGIDFHWIHNAHGVVEVAKMMKKINPKTKVILGGYSASYYHYQILKYYKSIDAVIRGDGEIPLLKFTQYVKQNKPLNSVPNLSYRDSKNKIKINPLSYVATNLDDLNFTNLSLLNNAKQYLENSRKIMGISFNLPIGRGCPFNCPFCAGGQRAQLKLSGRNKVILRTPMKVVEDIQNVVNEFKIQSVFFGHGTYPANLKYWKNLFRLIQKEKLDIGGDLEIWRLPFPKEMWKMFYKAFTRRYSSISISPRTTSSRVHQKIAQICDPTFNFPKSQINDLIKNANLFRYTLRIWLTIGFPFQTRLDVLKDFMFGVKCVLKYGKSNFKPITVMNEPYYIFPGSPVYESPDKFSINLKFSSFPEVVEAFKKSKASHFYNVINYDTDNLNGNFIQFANMFLLLTTAPMFLTTGSKHPKMR